MTRFESVRITYMIWSS